MLRLCSVSRYPDISECQLEVDLARRCDWRAGVKELRNGGDKLRWRERLSQHNAVWDALGCPIVRIFAAHINNGKTRVDLSGGSGNIPAVDPASPKINIGHQRPIFSIGRVKQLHRVFA